MKRFLTAALCALLLGGCVDALPAKAQQGPFTPLPPADITQNGTFSNQEQFVTVQVNGVAVCVASVQGNFVGTIVPEVSLDGITYQSENVFSGYGSGTANASISSSGIYVGPAGGVMFWRLHSTSWTSGAASVAIRCSAAATIAAAANTVTASQSNGALLHVTVDNSTSGAPLTGGSSAVTPGSNQSIGVHGYNGSTLDALRSGGHTGQGGLSALSAGVLYTNALAHCVYSTVGITAVSGNSYPCQLTSVGAVKVDGSGVTQPVSGTVTANAGSGTFSSQLVSSSAQIGYLQSWTYASFTTTTATVIKASAGVLAGFNFVSQNGMASTSNAVTCYDNPTALSGHVIFTGQLPAGIMPNFPAGGIKFTSGLTCAVTTGSALSGTTVDVYYN